MKKTPAKKSTRFESGEEETAHYNAILIEDLKDQFRFVAEKVGSMEESLRTQMTQDKKELKQEIFDNRRALEMKVDRVLDKLTQHDEEISSLKQATDHQTV